MARDSIGVDFTYMKPENCPNLADYWKKVNMAKKVVQPTQDEFKAHKQCLQSAIKNPSQRSGIASENVKDMPNFVKILKDLGIMLDDQTASEILMAGSDAMVIHNPMAMIDLNPQFINAGSGNRLAFPLRFFPDDGHTGFEGKYITFPAQKDFKEADLVNLKAKMQTVFKKSSASASKNAESKASEHIY